MHIRTVGHLATFGETTRRREHGLRLGALAEVAMATDAARVAAYTADIAECAPGARVLEVGRFNGRGESTGRNWYVSTDGGASLLFLVLSAT